MQMLRAGRQPRGARTAFCSECGCQYSRDEI
jgi:hypothetical protein